MKENTFFIRQVIGDNIRENRKLLGLTQEQFAEAADLSIQFLSALENGTKFARMDTYCRIAEVLKFPLYDLLVPRIPRSDLDDQFKHLLLDCDTEEKQTLLKITGEIKRHLRTKR